MKTETGLGVGMEIKVGFLSYKGGGACF